ncbi:MAG TPA: hypothetical protein VJ482_01605 [Acidimicrobiia bacterium]|nr:hypothetical protein [Acidimicrobiia bacterium]
MRSSRWGPWTDDLDQIGPAGAERLGFPSFVLDHLALARTHSYPDAPLSDAEERYPVIVYSHGWTGFRTVNVDQSEALASHGYVVVSIDHTYGSIVTVFPDGRSVGLDQNALPEGEDVGEEAYQACATISLRPQRGVDPYDNDRLLVALYTHGGGGQYLASISGTEHWDFVVMPLLTPLAPLLGLKGPIKSERVMAITDDLLVSFFGSHLRGGIVTDVAGLRLRYPEVTLETRPG